MLYLLAFLGALVAGGINVLAGNGSAITLTILMELLGLPADVANGTNRVGVIANGLGGVLGFRREGRYRNQSPALRRQMWLIVGVISLGAVLGVYFSLIISNAAFRAVFRWLLVVMLVVVLARPKRWLQAVPGGQRPLPAWLSAPLYFALGVYAGFIQMGFGVFFLGLTVLAARYDLIQANVLKALAVTVCTLFAVAIFAWRGLIDWPVGLVMAAGQYAGGYVTARFAARDERAGTVAYWVLVTVLVVAIGRAFVF